MKIAVGSENPVKLKAISSAFTSVWPQKKFVFEPTFVNSGVADQPQNDTEMIQGAKNRARLALRNTAGADFGVGIEGGLYPYEEAWYGRSWVAVLSQGGKLGLGSSVSCPIPPNMVKLVSQGKDLKEVCEIIYGVKDIGKKVGYFGLLTNNLITRRSAYRDAVIMALTVFSHQPQR